MTLYLGAAGTRKQAIIWLSKIMPNLSDELVSEIADLSDNNKLIVRDPSLWPEGRIDANDEAAPRIREIVRDYQTLSQSSQGATNE